MAVVSCYCRARGDKKDLGKIVEYFDAGNELFTLSGDDMEYMKEDFEKPYFYIIYLEYQGIIQLNTGEYELSMYFETLETLKGALIDNEPYDEDMYDLEINENVDKSLRLSLNDLTKIDNLKFEIIAEIDEYDESEHVYINNGKLKYEKGTLCEHFFIDEKEAEMFGYAYMPENLLRKSFYMKDTTPKWYILEDKIDSEYEEEESIYENALMKWDID